MNVFSYILLTFVLNMVIETPIVLSIMRNTKLLSFLYILLINLFTWPIANYLISVGFNVLSIEAGVVLAEGILLGLLFRIKYKKAFLASLAANAASYLIGSYILNKFLMRAFLV